MKYPSKAVIGKLRAVMRVNLHMHYLTFSNTSLTDEVNESLFMSVTEVWLDECCVN